MRSYLRLAIATAVLSLAAPIHAEETPAKGIVAMQGIGEVTAVPDTAFINSGVTTEAKTAREALDANTEAMSQLVATLKAAGIAEKDIQTSNFSVQPQYVYSDQRDANGYNKPPAIVGYQVSNSVSVRVRALDTLGEVLDKAVTVGANTIGGISFSVADTSRLLDEARKKAFADASAKAKLYAEAAGTNLGRILEISENGGFAPQPMAIRAMAESFDTAAKVPIQSGELSYTVNVSVRWELGQ